MRVIREQQKVYDEGYKHFKEIVESIVSGEHKIQLSLKLGDGTENVATATTSYASSESASSSSSSLNATSTDQDLPTSSTEEQATSTRPGSSENVPSYRMNREVKTVTALWDEGTLGRCGNYSVKELEERWGTKWRRDDMNYFEIRKKVIDAIEDLQADVGLKPPSAITLLQTVLSNRQWPLYRLGKALQIGEYFPKKKHKVNKQ